MKVSKLFTKAAITIVSGAILMLQPLTATAFNPQPEPPGKQKVKGVSKPGETKAGIAPSPFQTDSTKIKGTSKPGETKMGLEPSPFQPDSVKNKGNVK